MTVGDAFYLGERATATAVARAQALPPEGHGPWSRPERRSGPVRTARVVPEVLAAAKREMARGGYARMEILSPTEVRLLRR